MMMHEKNRVFLLIAIMGGAILLVSALTISLLYRASVEQQRQRLVETVESESCMIGAIFRNISRQHPDRSAESILQTTVNQVTEAHNNYERAGHSTEFTLARRMGNLIVFLLRHRHDSLKTSTIVKWGVGLAEPMQMALSGKSGTLFGRDYRGQWVLAAYEPVEGLGLGLVAKIDVTELREPLIKAGAASLALALLVVFGGVVLFQRIAGPMVYKLQRHSRRLEEINVELNLEIVERQNAQHALSAKAIELKVVNDELEKRVQERTAEIEMANLQLKKEVQERHQAQEKLGRSKEMLQAVFDGILDPLILLDRNMTILMLNKAAFGYYGLNTSPEITYGNSCIAAFGHSRGCEGCQVPEAVRERRYLDYERQGLMDPTRLERVVVYPLQESGEAVGKAVVHIIDITEAKQIEKQMIHSEKLASLGMLVASIAHEINNPNNFISFNIPILKEYIESILPITDGHFERNPDVELCNLAYPEFRQDIMKLMGNIDHGSDRIKIIVRNLKEFSQLKERRRKEWIDPTEPITRALSICNNKIKNSVRTFICEVPDNLPRVFSDPNTLEQILINLLINAAQASDKKDSWAKLKITVTESWLEHMVIEVSDNGRGMDPETSEKIFDPFFTTRASAEGTGLGLYVCQNLVRWMGGRVEVESEPGKGSKFTVFLHDKERREKPRN